MDNKIANQDIKFRNSVDGLWDIGIACALIIAGIAFLTDMVAVTAGFYFPIFLLIVGLKRKVVQPRIGYVEHKGMNMKTRKMILFVLIIGIVFFALGLFVYMQVAKGQNSEKIIDILRNYGAIIMGLVIGFILILIAKTFSINRFYGYSVLIFLAFLAMKFIDYEYIISVSLLTCGAIILAIGLTLFINFIRKYPKLGEAQDE